MEFETTVTAVKMYSTYKSWWFTGLLYTTLTVILSLAIFEEPTIKVLEDFAINKFWVLVRLKI